MPLNLALLLYIDQPIAYFGQTLKSRDLSLPPPPHSSPKSPSGSTPIHPTSEPLLLSILSHQPELHLKPARLPIELLDLLHPSAPASPAPSYSLSSSVSLSLMPFLLSLRYPWTAHERKSTSSVAAGNEEHAAPMHGR